MSVVAHSESIHRANVLGIPVDCVTMEQALAFIEERIAERTPSLVVTLDASGLVLAKENRAFQAIVDQASLISPDSVGILWALGRQGISLPRTVSGVNLVAELCRMSADKGYRLYFLGSAPGVAEQAADRLRLRYPGCNIVGTRDGFFPAESDEVVAAEVAEFKPDVLFVAMGMPRQEEFIVRTMNIVRAPISIGVGGSFDVFSGRTKRAPVLIQKLRLEWFWRVMLNPRKVAKVKNLPKFVWLVLRSRT